MNDLIPLFLELLLRLSTVHPPGFEEADRFEDANTACDVLTDEMVHPVEQKAVGKYCRYRTHHSSRGNKIESRIDGSWVHDRDRPAAWAMWARRVRHGRLRPDVCPWHRIDREVRRPKAAKKLAKNWPFAKPVMTPEKTKVWMKRPYDVERMGTRGPHDHNLGAAQRWLPGCYPPEALDRYDVSVAITVLHAREVCERFGCKSWRDIRANWRA